MANAPALHPALLPFLDTIDHLPSTLAWKEAEKLERYFLGTQYKDRDIDEEGYTEGGHYGARSRSPAWRERKISAVWNLRAEVAEKLTGWAVGGSNWCHLEVPGDEDAEDFLTTVAEEAGMSAVVAEARTYGGAMRVAIVSLAIDEGEFLLEAHMPKGFRVLEWANARRHRPRAVVSIQRGDNPDAKSDQDYPWTARYWDEQVEAQLVRVKNETQGRWIWVVEEIVTHGLGWCPIFWCPNAKAPTSSHLGQTDADNVEGLIDSANYLMAAGDATTKRNADDTLVVKTSPDNNPGKPLRKGGYNAIFSEGGAEYLSQDGESARICMEFAKERASQMYRRAGVDMIDPKDAAAQTSGEARKMANLNTAERAAQIRDVYSKGLIRPIALGILDAARKVGPARLRIPPRVEDDKTVKPRTPGKANFVRCAWPTMFPPTATDTLALVQTATTATGGKQVLSQRSAVKMLAASAAVPVENVDEEVEAITEDTQAAAKLQQEAFAAAPEPGQAGPVDEPKEGAEG